MSKQKIPQLDSVIHSPVRLAVISILISAKEANFNHLKKTIGTTDGNLSTHLTKLEQNGLIKIRKTFVGKKPATFCKITPLGRQAFARYVEAMEKIIKR